MLFHKSPFFLLRFWIWFRSRQRTSSKKYNAKSRLAKRHDCRLQDPEWVRTFCLLYEYARLDRHPPSCYKARWSPAIARKKTYLAIARGGECFAFTLPSLSRGVLRTDQKRWDIRATFLSSFGSARWQTEDELSYNIKSRPYSLLSASQNDVCSGSSPIQPYFLLKCLPKLSLKSARGTLLRWLRHIF